MKFIYTAVIALAVLAFAGCGAKKEALPSTQNAPKFENAATNEFVKAYSDVANEVAVAYKAKDYTKIASLSTKMAEITGKSADALKGLKDADSKKLTDWINAVTQELADAAAKAAK
ncbi:hypothetical protein M2103_002545 [Ereboglobus sp. PH5-5]|uniref:hypothetical protein n=1 Tax=unclassified Ereboglobus TaxID=2626932 RepID=UPI002405598C|nr:MULTISPECIES: hypothetical protein [unclassified Ereboglobus]MDF9828404.1 hypothetical protein [Ereboglobus sp. PH5-10]MDF9834300.1 hypothetical protein [Ereboglobus sp. PH5-5]